MRPVGRTGAWLLGALAAELMTTGHAATVTQSDRWIVATGLPPEPVVGLLDLPEIVGEACGPQAPGSANLYERPTEATAIGSVSLRVIDPQPDGTCGDAQLVVRRTGSTVVEELPTDESGYEIKAAVVYERSGLWFRIALPRGSAWIQRRNADDFLPYPENLKERLAYVRERWDGRLWETPGVGAGARVPPAWTAHLDDDIPIEVLESRQVGNVIWVRVRLLSESCGNTLDGVEVTTGWMPAYRASGATSVWFYSRGC